MGEFPSKEHQIKKGEIRNPTGKGGGHGITYYLKKILQELNIDEDKTHAEVIAKKIIAKAEKGEMWPANVVMDRTDGKVTQPIQVEPININVTYTDKSEEEKEDA